ncbi:MAG: glycosyltransferase family 39 protein [Pirellulales bacterium]|nr:glycosyltransferase family 39 protein [Pirellulales bacterium]
MRATLPAGRSAASAETPLPPSSAHDTAHLGAELAVLALVLAAYFAARWPFSELPLMRDEGEYAQMGQALRQGLLPYRDIYNQKPPVVFAIFAALQAIAGEGLLALRLATTVWAAAATTLTWIVARRLFGPVGALGTALVMVELLFDLAGVFHSASTELFMLLWVAAALACWYPRNRRGWPALAAAGVFAALACQTKQTGIALVGFLCLERVWAWLTRREPGEPLRQVAADLGNVLTAFAIANAAIVAPFVLTGTWQDYVTCVWTNNFAYVGHRHQAIGPFEQIRTVAIYLVNYSAGTWIAGLLGCLSTLLAARGRAGGLWLLGVLTLVFCGVAGEWYVQYYIPLIIPLALGCGCFFAWAGRITLDPKAPIAARLGAVALLLAATAGPLYKQWPTLADVSRAVYRADQSQPFDESLQVGRYLAEHTQPGEPILVVGSDPEIYFYAQRLPATRMVITYPACGPYPHSANLRDELLAGFDRPDLRYVVLVNYPGALSEFPELIPQILEPTLKRLASEYQRSFAVHDRHQPALMLEVYRRRATAGRGTEPPGDPPR